MYTYKCVHVCACVFVLGEPFTSRDKAQHEHCQADRRVTFFFFFGKSPKQY